MTWSSLIVYVDDEPDSAQRIARVCDLAMAHDAHLIGVSACAPETPMADAYGAVLHSATAQEYEQATAGMPSSVRLDGATVHVGARSIALDLPAGDIAIAANAHTLAITSPWTHAIRLLPLA